jgi:2-(1,2-epoxy-1,2-dihydrophenyl)acetyl-CoA isomerase
MSLLNLETIECRRTGGVAWLILNRPDALNAWTRQLGVELTQALENAAADRSVRAIVLTGAGRAFSSGADLRSGIRSVTEAGAPDVRTELREVYHPLILRVRTAPKPVIAAVNGPAVGIGASLALASDLIVAARSAYFLMAFVNIGLSLDGGASQTLVARVGHARAFEIAYLGERIAAETALQWGLVNEVVPDDRLQQRVGELTDRLAAGLLCRDQANDQRPRLRRLCRASRPGGRCPAGAGRVQGLRRGRDGVPGEAPAGIHGGLAPRELRPNLTISSPAHESRLRPDRVRPARPRPRRRQAR